MANCKQYSEIERLVQDGNVDEAERQLRQAFAEDGTSAALLYIEGLLHMKRSEWGKAMSSFKQAHELGPASPAFEYLCMLSDIMAFYNKDMYNQ